VSATLKNKRILVTRPAHQADQLCRLISDAGGIPVLFPTIEIRPVLNPEKLSAKLSACFANIDQYDFIIFVSRNAVTAVFDHYLSKDGLLAEKIQILAIGSGTAAALSELAMSDVLHAGVQADSESLLLLPELDSELVRNKKILIVRGVGGRELLADNLKQRGALVDYAEVYQRALPEYDIQQCRELWQNEQLDAVIISSNEGLENLLKLTADADQEKLFKTPLIVMSARNAELAKQTGFITETAIAKEKNDEGLLLALLELVGEIQV
jgi:uroporphyrinogen-III synthase